MAHRSRFALVQHDGSLGAVAKGDPAAPGFPAVTPSSRTVSRELAADPRVQYAEPQFIEHLPGRFQPNDPQYRQQWHLNNTGQLSGISGADIRAEQAWDVTRGSGVRLAVIDNGFNIAHPDLADAVAPSSGHS